MKGVLAILGLVACASAFQYSVPKYGMLYKGDDYFTGIYSKFYGPYSKQYYQQEKFGTPEYHQDDYKHFEKYEGYQKDHAGHFDNVQYHHEQHHEFPEKYHHDVKTYEHKVPHVDDQFFAKKQKDVFNLLKFINSEVYDETYQQIFKTFNIEKYAEYYHHDAFKHFMHYWENQMFLPKGEIFSIFNDVHVEQVKVLYNLFYTAKDYETFFKTAVWARQYFNEGMFLYTYSVAVIHREDMHGIVLPPIYEIYPHYFFPAEVMQKAYYYKMAHYNQEQAHNQVYTIRANYTGYYLNVNPEQSLSYYLEDVGINAFYYYFNLYYPYWMNSSEYKLNDKRGELFYYLHQQLVAKYYLERLSHGVGGIDYFNWEVPFETGFYPSLTYPNGLSFAERPNFADLQEYFANYGQHWCFISKYGYAYTYVQTYEQRIREAIDLGFIYTYDGKKVDLYTPEGFNILANIIEGNADSLNQRYYGSYVNYARHLLGYAKQPLDNYKVAPSALEHFETSMRDPAFYKLFKKVTLLFQKYKHNLPAYTKKDLYFPGFKVEQFEVEPLVTYYDKFYADITNGLTVTPEEYKHEPTYHVQVEQYRLNHKNFNYKLYVNADKPTTATVKVFLGPKYDEHGRTMDFYENRMNFVQFDYFTYNFKAGQNMIVRNSLDFNFYTKDKTTFFEVYKNVMSIHKEEQYLFFGFPQRFSLPRGSIEGTSFQFYVIVYPYHDQEIKYENTFEKFVAYKKIVMESYPLGFPFDRPAEFENVYYVPNAFFKDVKIYHQVLNNEQTHHHHDFVKQEYHHAM